MIRINNREKKKEEEEVRSLEEISKKPFGEFKTVHSLQDDKC
jgi:hypothetical protein